MANQKRTATTAPTKRRAHGQRTTYNAESPQPMRSRIQRKTRKRRTGGVK